MDNRIFRVNGGNEDMLEMALKLAFEQSGFSRCSGWQETKEHGLILCWHDEEESITPLPANLTATQITPFVLEWLKNAYAKDIDLSEWCGDCDHDGHNSKGWYVYCGDWGHVGDQRYSICAIKPCFMWHGK